MATTYLPNQDPTLERSFRGHKDVITALSFKPSMSQLASSSLDHSIMIWNFKPQLRAFRFVGHKGPVTSLDFSRNGTILASCSRDKTVRLWTPNVKGDVTVFKAHTSSVRSVEFSRDSEQLLTASDDKSIKLWSTHRTKFQYTLGGHLNWVRVAKFSPDGRLVLSGSDDKTVKLWDLRSKQCVKTYWDHTGIVSGVTFHPSGTVIATCSMDRSIKLFDIRTHKLIQHYGEAHGASSQPSSIEGYSGLSGGVNSVGFGGRNGEYLISSGMDGVVKIWDVKEGHLFYTLHGHKNGPTTAAVFSPDGDFFATGGSDSQVMVWKSNFGNPLADGDRDYDPSNFGRVGITPTLYSHNDTEQLQPAATKKTRPQSASPVRSISPVHPPKVATANPSHSRPSTAPASVPEPAPIQISAPIVSNVEMMDLQSNRQEDVATSPLQVQEIPDQIAHTLSHIVRQIDILTQTMSILESRLTINEDRMLEMAQKFHSAGNPTKPTSMSAVGTVDSTTSPLEKKGEELYNS